MSKRRARRAKLPSAPVELEITSLSHEGRGIANIDGKVAFVDGALAGEKVVASYVRKRSKFDELKVLEVLSSSPQRVEPSCEVATECGGCSLQHMASNAQIELKQSVLLEQLQHATKNDLSDLRILPIIQAEHFHYRRKARLAVRLVTKKGGVLVGFREKYSSFITEMSDCKVLVSEVAQLIQPLREFLSRLEACQAIPQIEVAVGEEQSDGVERRTVALVFRHLEVLSDGDLALFSQFAAEHAIELYLQPGSIDSVHKLFPSNGINRLQYFLPDYGLTMAFHPMDFTQINAEINRLIINKAIELLDLQDDDVVLDLFCGLGNFTLPIATRAKQVVGIEGSEEMVKRGEENSSLNGLLNTSFYAANLFNTIEDKDWSKLKYSKILLDPPRSGAVEIIQELAKLGAKKIVYISCNPATLARDTAYLIQYGYTLKSAGVMDMFPHTTHVESMAEFERTS